MVKVSSGSEALFWKDRWFKGLAPMHIWPEEFHDSSRPNGTVRELAYLLRRPPFANDPEAMQFLSSINLANESDKDMKTWSLTANGAFSVKSFYGLLNEGGLRCSLANAFWKGPCPKKVNIFNWLAWKNKILSLENLALRRCNRLPTDTCVLCHSAAESVDHLFLHCRFSQEVWDQLRRMFQLPALPNSMSLLWGVWRSALGSSAWVVGDGVVKAFVWSIWLTRNDYIFSAKCVNAISVLRMTGHLILSWFSAAPDGQRVKLEDSISSIRRSLEFIGPRTEGLRDAPTVEVDPEASEE